MGEVSLRVGDKIFTANKELLCEYSDYFRAMFSGYYVESDKEEINIDMLDPNITSIILKYMKLGMILLSEYPLSTIGEIAIAANFLQIVELVKQIQYVLEIQLSESNWVETMLIAQNASYSQLEQYSAAYGLYSFNTMKPQYIPTINTLVWYLCHPYLGSHEELNIFKFGVEWLFKNHRMEDTLLILACLDMRKVTNKILRHIKEYMSSYNEIILDQMVNKIIDCLLELSSKNVEISETSLCKYKSELCEKFSEHVWSNIMTIVKQNRSRLLKYVPVAPLWNLKDHRPDFVAHSLYTFDEEKGFEHYLEVAEKNLWGWNVAAWGLTKIVVVCGEYGRGTGIFMRDVKVYDTLKKEWTQFGVQLPATRHAGVTTVGDLLYIVGGVGEFRVVLEATVVYDLKQRSCRRSANLPDAIQSPAVCTHKNIVYAAGQKYIYFLDTSGDKDYWKVAAESNLRMTLMRSFGDHIYCMQSYFSRLYRFCPGTDEHVYSIATFSHLPAAMFNLGDFLMVFTRKENDEITVETYRENAFKCDKPNPLPLVTTDKRVNDVAGVCCLVMTMPPLYKELPEYHTQYLTQHSNS